MTRRSFGIAILLICPALFFGSATSAGNGQGRSIGQTVTITTRRVASARIPVELFTSPLPLQLFTSPLPVELFTGPLPLHGKVFDALTKEPIEGATILVENDADPAARTQSGSSAQRGTRTDASGAFTLEGAPGTTLVISAVGHTTVTVKATIEPMSIALPVSNNQLQEVVLSANRTLQKRSESPIAIASISKQAMEDTKAQRLDYLLNQVSGVNMINLGNEQHEMSIRQPMSTNNLFLYLEDGIPIRTSGVFNHNALLEMNMAAASSIEIIKGPASSLYGAEAIGGVVNVITQAPPVVTRGTLSLQVNDEGYKRVDASMGSTFGKVGFIISGYYANQTDGPIQYSDFHKSASTYRLDYHIDSHTTWTNSFTYVDYFSDMYGQLDSTHFAQKNYAAQIFFTYRKVYAARGKSVLTHAWNAHSTTTATFMYRNNSVIQNPSYSIGSYHVGGNAVAPISADTATGNINDNAFTSYGLSVQHVQRWAFLQSKLIIGTNAEINPQSFYEDFLWVRKKQTGGLTNYVSYTNPDSLLARYRTNITDFGGYLDYEFTPAKDLRVTAALRYDAFQYMFVNYLEGSPITGGPSSVTNYHKLAPKVGLTYNLGWVGFYGNYSVGYVPPQITDVFTKTANNTYLLPQTFHSEEAGGWFSLINQALYADWSAYLMNGADEIISVRLPDGTFASENAGHTRHMGLEYGITYRPGPEWLIRISASNAKHTFVNYISGGTDYDGKEMADAPHFFGNASMTYKPRWAKGLRASLEWQRVGRYYMDNLEQYTYKGYHVANLRLGYGIQHFEVWLNALNVFNEYYSTISTVSVSSGVASYSYQLGDPRALTLGISYHFGK
jgi:outer membrane receptor protein involved in Fe transport